MRRMVFVVCAALTAALFVSLSTLSAQAQSADQYGPSDGTEASQDTSQSPAPDAKPSGASPSAGGSISQGSVAKADSPEVVAARRDVAEEERLPAYTRVVDNTTKGAFRAPGWKVRRGSLSHGGSFVVPQKSKAPARFTVKIPSSNDYSVYAWWPEAAKGGTARVGVQGASGTKWSKVDQGAAGGMWVKVGTYAMSKGKRSVRIAARSAAGGRVAADAVAVVRGEGAPPEDRSAAGKRSVGRAGTTSSFTGRDVVRQARKYIGDRYRYSTCTQTAKSCTCLTRMAVLPFGHRMYMTENSQWKYSGSKFIPKSRLRPGDEVFFKEGGSQYITHVGIYAGNGRIVHASSYWGRVVEKEMKYIDGYFGAKRFSRTP